MIPKVIHYCWFGGNPLPELAQKCIASWEKYMPDYEIRQWDETNFNLECCDYVREAYRAKKWAFVSDYARFWILYHEGGIYFDTDVEVIQSLEEILSKGPFMGCEKITGPSSNLKIAPGLGMAASRCMPIFREILDFYEQLHFQNSDGSENLTTIVTYTTDIFKRHGWKQENEVVEVAGIFIYPAEYFCPMDYYTGKITCTKKTYTIHHYSASWQEPENQYLLSLRWKYGGKGTLSQLWLFVVTKILGAKRHLRKQGLQTTLKYAKQKWFGRKV